MYFIGQKHIMKQLQIILPELFEKKNIGCNILLRAPSGYGKTTMALSICKYLSGNFFQIYWADWTEYNFRKRVIFIDEIHRIKQFEVLYGPMDSGKHVFIFATNQDGNLPEALCTRCYEFIFGDYSTEELMLIAKDSSSFSTTDESLEVIVESGNRNPRVIKSLVSRLNIYFDRSPEINSRTANFREIMKNIFSIEDGLDNLCRNYLQTLQDLGGTSSLFLLKSVLHVDENTLKREVEPILVKKGKIRITSRGRSLNDSI